MNNDLKLNVLQDFIDLNGGTFNLSVKWYNGKLYIAEDKGMKGGVVEFTQMPLSENIEADIKKEVLKSMPGLRRVSVNKNLVIKQTVKKTNVLSLQNKFEQFIDFDLVLNAHRPASIKMYTLQGIQRLEHDYTYIRALFTTNPYFATVFAGIRIVPYSRDIEELGNQVVKTVKEYAQELISNGTDETTTLQFKVVKAFEISFYLDGQDVTETIHELFNQQSEERTSLDEFGFIAYIAYYQLFDGELNNHVPLKEI